MPVGAATVMVAGETPNDLNSDKLGEFSRRVGQEVNGRPIYHQVGNDNRMIWYAAGYWYLGKKNELGKSQGWLCVRDPAPAPELVQSIWRVGDGERLHQAPNVRCAAIGARTIEVLAPVNGLHKDKMVSPYDVGDGGEWEARLREGAAISHGMGVEWLLVRRQARRAR